MNTDINGEIDERTCYTCDKGFDDCECEEQDQDLEREDDLFTDVEADADTLASAGWGTDEDYGYYGGDEDY